MRRMWRWRRFRKKLRKFKIQNSMAKTKVSEEEIDALLDAAEWDHAVFWGKELVMSFRLACGFTVTGRRITFRTNGSS